MKLTVLKPKERVFVGEVDSVTLPGEKGLFTLLNGHAPIISILVKGKMSYHIKDNPELVSVIVPDGGFVKVLKDSVTVCIN